MDVVGKEQCLRAVFAHIVERHVVALVGRDEAVLLAVEDDPLQAFPVRHGQFAEFQFVSREVLQADVEAQLAHRGHVGAELHRALLVPARHVGTHRLGREELREAPLDVETLEGVRVVAAPELREVFQRLVVAARAAARAEHHRHLRIVFLHAAHHVVHAPNVVDIELALLRLEVRRVGIGDGAVAVPLEESHFGVLLHDFLHHAVDIVLHLRVAQVEHELVAVVVSRAVGQFDGPVGVLFEEFALRVHHFRFNPDAELHAGLLRRLDQCGHPFGEFRARGVPVAEARVVVLARVLVAEPSVVEQEHVHAEVLCVLHQVGQDLLVKVEARVFPVVQQCQSAAHAVLQAVAAGPVVEAAAALGGTLLAQRKDKFGCREGASGFEFIVRGVGVDAGDYAQVAHVVHLEGEAEVARPAQRAHEHFALVFGHGLVQAHFEEGVRLHGRAAAEGRVDDLLAELKLLAAHLRLACPVAAELREVVGVAVEVDHGRAVGREHHGALFVVNDFGPRLDDVFFRVGHIVEHHLERVLVVAQLHRRVYPAGHRFRPVRNVEELRRRVAVVVEHGKRGVKVVLAAATRIGFPSASGDAAVGTGVDVPFKILKVRFVNQFGTEISLVEPAVVAHLQEQVSLFRTDADYFLLVVRLCPGKDEEREEE